MGDKWIRADRLEKAERQVEYLRFVLREVKKFIPGTDSIAQGYIDGCLADAEKLPG